MGNTLLAASVATVPGKLRYLVRYRYSLLPLRTVAIYTRFLGIFARDKNKSKMPITVLRLSLLPSCIPIAEFYAEFNQNFSMKKFCAGQEKKENNTNASTHTHTHTTMVVAISHHFP